MASKFFSVFYQVDGETREHEVTPDKFEVAKDLALWLQQHASAEKVWIEDDEGEVVWEKVV